MATIGMLMGLIMGAGSDSVPMYLIPAPGVLVGVIAAAAFGRTAGMLTCAVANGAAYGFLMYAWDRLANRAAARLPIWSESLALWLRDRRR